MSCPQQGVPLQDAPTGVPAPACVCPPPLLTVQQRKALDKQPWHRAVAPLHPIACRLEQLLLSLSQALVQWSGRAAEGLAALLVGPAGRPPWLLQFTAGCCSITALVSLAKRLGAGMQPGTAYRIAAACQLVFDTGRHCIAIITAEIEADVAAGGPPDQVTLGLLASLAAYQLEAVVGCMLLLQQDRQTTVGAAFARSTARPAVLLPWLAAIARAVLVLKDEVAAPDSSGRRNGLWYLCWHPCCTPVSQFDCLCCCATWVQPCLSPACLPATCLLAGPSVVRYFTTLAGLLALETYRDQAMGIAADAALQDGLAGAVLTSCLPLLAARLAAAVAEGLPPSSHAYVKGAGMLASTLQRLQLAPAVARHMRRPGAAAIMHHAAAVVAAVAALPADLPDGLAVHWLVQDSLLAMHLNAAELLALCSSGLSQPAAPAGGAGSSGGSSGSSSGGGSGGNSSSVDAADLSSEQLALAWELVAAVPHIASAMQALVAAAPANDLGLQVQASVASEYSTAVGHIPAQLADVPCSAAQLSTWAAAVEASLRLHPLLWQLDAALQPLTDESQLDQSVAGLLAARLRGLFCCRVPLLAEGALTDNSAAEQPTPAALRRQLLQAHLAGCRAVHWLAHRAAVSDGLELAGRGMPLRDMLLKLLLGLCHVLLRVLVVECSHASLRSG